MQMNPSLAAAQDAQIPPHVAGDLVYDLIRTLKLLFELRDRQTPVVPGLEASTQPILHRLARTDGLRVSDLAASMRADVSTVSRYATTLANLGLVDKTPDADDRRALVVSLTPQGRDAVAAMHDQRTTAMAQILHAWTPDEVARFRVDIDRFASAVEDYLTDSSSGAAGAASERLSSTSIPGVLR